MATPDSVLRDRAIFWLVVGVLGLLVTPFIINSPRCLESKTEKVLETYYDFSSSGVGVWQEEVNKTTCLKWDR